MDVVFSWIAQYGALALFALLMLGIVGLPVPDETLLTFAGYLIFTHKLAPGPTVTAALLGSMCGITLSYAIGRMFGPDLIHRAGHLVRIHPQDLDRMRAWFIHWGKYTLLACYFVPGVRHLAALAAGSSRLPPAVFAPFAYAGGVLWSGTFLTLGYALGEEGARLSPLIQRLLMLAGGITAMILAVFFIVRKRNDQNRRL